MYQRAILFWYIYIVYALVITVLAIFMFAGMGTTKSDIIITWMFIGAMFADAIIFFVFRNVLASSMKRNLLGPAILLYTIAISPTIYGLVLTIFDYQQKFLGPILGLIITLALLMFARRSVEEIYLDQKQPRFQEDFEEM